MLSRESLTNCNLEKMEEAILQKTELGDLEGLTSDISVYFEAFQSEGQYFLRNAQVAAVELIVKACRALFSTEESPDSLNLVEVIPLIFLITNIFNLTRFVSATLKDIAQRFQSKFSNQNNQIVERVYKYICENFKKNFSMQDISKAVCYSPNYVSLVFSKQTGQTIKEYITSVRIEHAKTLLLDKSIMIFEIADKCGFSTPYYFSTVFRKIVGVSPKQYRDREDSRSKK
jgi:two-component system, response regulator YesN